MFTRLSRGVSSYLSGVVQSTVSSLLDASCIELDPSDLNSLLPTPMGRLAAHYYLSHLTMHLFVQKLTPAADLELILNILAHAHEFAELPVRHNEDNANEQLSRELPLEAVGSWDSAHTKAHLLLQVHFTRLTHILPVCDYVTDTKLVLDQAPRIVQSTRLVAFLVIKHTRC
ncbi:unnamed protein product [Protopolystoma xenopodis]|uniref:SEC63 domain-containing protein n=1 Tax=Protopolystoma xenopodis TaxID=117903 RepID=A0A3S4ZXS6_9PLAT|nr:unnamed protein product [Protopolystoma xenopodis]